jgi:hypothetical protein
VAGDGRTWIGTGCVTMNRLAARVLTGWPRDTVSFGPTKMVTHWFASCTSPPGSKLAATTPVWMADRPLLYNVDAGKSGLRLRQ